MDALSELIKILNNTDKYAFKRYLKDRNKRDCVKNIELFEFLETDDIFVREKLYKSSHNHDAYHALRKRLYDSLLLFLSQRVFESTQSSTNTILRLLVVGRFLFESDLPKIAFKCLNKAENLATAIEQYTLLNEIMLLQLQYAHLEGAPGLDELTTRLLKNQQLMLSESKLNMVYAYLRRELKQIHLQGKIVNLTDLIIKTVRQYKVAINDLMTYKNLHHILFIATEYAAIQQNYGLIEKYIRRSHKFIQRQKDIPILETHRFYYLSILYFFANYDFRSKNFVKSMAYLGEMKMMMKVDKRLYQQFHLRSQLLEGLNLYFSGKGDQAVEFVKRVLSNIDRRARLEDVEDLRLSLTMFLAQQEDRLCLRYLADMARTDAWYERKMGMLWTIRKAIMEILIRIQFEHLDLANTRILTFKRRYKKYLIEIGEHRVLEYILLLGRYLDDPAVVSDFSFRQEVYDLLDAKENADIFNRSFIAWLIARWEKRQTYSVMLSLLV